MMWWLLRCCYRSEPSEKLAAAAFHGRKPVICSVSPVDDGINRGADAASRIDGNRLDGLLMSSTMMMWS